MRCLIRGCSFLVSFSYERRKNDLNLCFWFCRGNGGAVSCATPPENKNICSGFVSSFEEKQKITVINLQLTSILEIIWSEIILERS